VFLGIYVIEDMLTLYMIRTVSLIGWLTDVFVGVCTSSSVRWGTWRFIEPWGWKHNAEWSNEVQTVHACWRQHVVLALWTRCLLFRVHSAVAAAAVSNLSQLHQWYCPRLGFATHPATRLRLTYRTARVSCWDLVNNLSVVFMYIAVVENPNHD